VRRDDGVITQLISCLLSHTLNYWPQNMAAMLPAHRFRVVMI
jgi:hypothetical protein